MFSVGHAYRRHLPHYQNEGRTYFVTFATKGRWILLPEARDVVLQHVVLEHEWRIFLHVAVVMPDHVHFIGTPFPDSRWRRSTKASREHPLARSTSSSAAKDLFGRTSRSIMR